MASGTWTAVARPVPARCRSGKGGERGPWWARAASESVPLAPAAVLYLWASGARRQDRGGRVLRKGSGTRLREASPTWADHTDQEAPSRAHLGLLGGAVTMDWKLFYWANFIGVLLFFFNRKPKPHMSRPSIDCEGGWSCAFRKGTPPPLHTSDPQVRPWALGSWPHVELFPAPLQIHASRTHTPSQVANRQLAADQGINLTLQPH